ncbi:MAG: hypothetical protein MJZ81_00890 [Bacteroidales bacterium]|nr:hypothetical protein [Bacteroidales bacterium]
MKRIYYLILSLLMGGAITFSAGGNGPSTQKMSQSDSHHPTASTRTT